MVKKPKENNTDNDLHYESIATYLNCINLKSITATITGASHIPGSDH